MSQYLDHYDCAKKHCHGLLEYCSHDEIADHKGLALCHDFLELLNGHDYFVIALRRQLDSDGVTVGKTVLCFINWSKPVLCIVKFDFHSVDCAHRNVLRVLKIKLYLKARLRVFLQLP